MSVIEVEQATEAPVVSPVDDVPLERLEVDLMSLAGHLAAAEAKWLVWLDSYDRRRGWESWECHSAAHWLSWKCGMSLPAARERVRVARAVAELPLVRAAMAAGELSYSKVRAITRAATPASEEELVRIGRTATASQLDRICAGIAASRGGDEPDVAVSKQFVATRNHHDGTSSLQARLTDDALTRVAAVIDTHVADLIAEGTADGEMTRAEFIESRGGFAALRAGAFEALITGSATVRTTVMVTVEVDVDDATNHENPVVERLACDCHVNLTVLDDENHQPLSVGRETRVVPKRIRDALNIRDHGMCQFPGCATTKGLHAHHIIHWLDGGRTEIENLVLVCSFHHHSIHDRNWHVGHDPIHPGRFSWRMPNGDPVTVGHSRGSVPEFYWHAKEQYNPNAQLEPIVHDRIQDLSWTVTAILHNEQMQIQRNLKHSRGSAPGRTG